MDVPRLARRLPRAEFGLRSGAAVALAMLTLLGGALRAAGAGALGLGEAMGEILYVRAADARWDIHLADARGDGEQRVTTSGDTEFDPRWSRDGREIAYHTRADDRVTIWRMPYEGGTPTPVAANVGGDYWAGYPMWAPDGQCLVYAGQHRPGDDRTDLKVACGGGPARTLLDTPDWNESGSDWSRDGQWIVYEGEPANPGPRDRGYWDVRRVHADGTGDEALVAWTGSSERHPRWSPDGRYLALLSYPGSIGLGSASLWLLDMASGDRSELVRGIAGPPAWSPTGTQLLVTGIDDAGPSPVAVLTVVGDPGTGDRKGLYLIDLVGRTVERLRGHAGGVADTNGPFEWGYGPDWSPGTPTPVPPTATNTTIPTVTRTPTPTPSATPTPRPPVIYVPLAIHGFEVAPPTATPVPSETVAGAIETSLATGTVAGATSTAVATGTVAGATSTAVATGTVVDAGAKPAASE